MNAFVEPRFSLELLSSASEHLLIPLVARADAHRRFPQLRFRDVYSELLLQSLELDAASAGELRLAVCEGRLLPRVLGWTHRRVTGRLYYGCAYIAV